MYHHIPNILTLLRIILIPAMVAVFYLPGHLGNWLACGLFVIASITDFFDGYLARAWEVQSALGRMLDPIADKLLVVTALVLLVSADRAHIVPALAIIGREIAVSGLREFLAEIRISVPVTQLAKIKTGVQMTAIGILLMGSEALGFPTGWLEMGGNIALWAAAILTLITGYAYLKAGLHHLQG